VNKSMCFESGESYRFQRLDQQNDVATANRTRSEI
jgi:hypothetical protein